MLGGAAGDRGRKVTRREELEAQLADAGVRLAEAQGDFDSIAAELDGLADDENTSDEIR